MLSLSGEVRGMKLLNLPSGDRHILIVEDQNFTGYEISLSDDHVRSGFPSQLNSLKGRQVKVPLKANLYKGRLYWNYDGNTLPVEITQAPAIKKVS